MTPLRTWTLSTAVALLLAGPVLAQCPTSSKPAKAPVPYVTKTYSVGHLAACPESADLLLDTITQAIKPTSWSSNGGKANIDYFPLGKALIVKQTPEGHKQIDNLLKALDKLQSVQFNQPCAPPVAPTHAALPHPVMPAACFAPAPIACCPPPARIACAVATPVRFDAPRPIQPSGAKQYGHFVFEGVKVNAMGVSCTVKRVRFMYRGDGIDNAVAKCALTGKYEETAGCACGDDCACATSKDGCKCGDACKCVKASCACGDNCKCAKAGCACGDNCKCATTKDGCKCGNACKCGDASKCSKAACKCSKAACMCGDNCKCATTKDGCKCGDGCKCAPKGKSKVESLPTTSTCPVCPMYTCPASCEEECGKKGKCSEQKTAPKKEKLKKVKCEEYDGCIDE